MRMIRLRQCRNLLEWLNKPSLLLRHIKADMFLLDRELQFKHLQRTSNQVDMTMTICGKAIYSFQFVCRGILRHMVLV